MQPLLVIVAMAQTSSMLINLCDFFHKTLFLMFSEALCVWNPNMIAVAT